MSLKTSINIIMLLDWNLLYNSVIILIVESKRYLLTEAFGGKPALMMKDIYWSVFSLLSGVLVWLPTSCKCLPNNVSSTDMHFSIQAWQGGG